MLVDWLVGWLVECCFTSTETVGLLGTGAQDVHLDFHTAPELCPGWEKRETDMPRATVLPPQWFCIMMGSGESHFSVLLDARGKFTKTVSVKHNV